jgi:hypothetical protein
MFKAINVILQHEEELPSEEDRCTSLSHLRRCTTDAKWKRSGEWFAYKCRSKKYYRLDDQHKPNRVIAKTEKSTAQIYYQLKTGHALIGPYLKRIKKSDDDKCWWCSEPIIQFLRSTEIGRRFRERGSEEDDPGG